MKTICAWCGVTMKEGSGEAVSHGLCVDCEKVEERKIDSALLSKGWHALCLGCGHVFFKEGLKAQYCRPECEMGHLR